MCSLKTTDKRCCICCLLASNSGSLVDLLTGAHLWWYCWLRQLTVWTWEEGDMCLCLSPPHAWCNSPAHSWMEMWELIASDWSISGCCPAHSIFSFKSKVLWLKLGLKHMTTWQHCKTVFLNSDTLALKTWPRWRDCCHHQWYYCCCQNEVPFVPGGSDDKNVLCPCVHYGGHSHWTWTIVKTMNKYAKLF